LNRQNKKNIFFLSCVSNPFQAILNHFGKTNFLVKKGGGQKVVCKFLGFDIFLITFLGAKNTFKKMPQ